MSRDTQASIVDVDFDDEITIPTWVLRDEDIAQLIKTAEQTLAESVPFDVDDIVELLELLRDLLAYRNYSPSSTSSIASSQS